MGSKIRKMIVFVHYRFSIGFRALEMEGRSFGTSEFHGPREMDAQLIILR
jgi:hypothetical protein